MSDQIALLEERVTQATTAVERIDAFLNLTEEIAKLDIYEASKVANQALDLSLKQEPVYRRGQAVALSLLSHYNSQLGHFQLALEQGQSALSILPQVNEKARIPATLNNVSAVYRKLGDISESLNYSLKQLEASTQLNDSASHAAALVGVGVGYIDLGERDPDNLINGVHYFERALGVFTDLNDTYGITMVLNNMCYTLTLMGKYDEAIDQGLKALGIARHNKHPKMELSAGNSLANAYLRQKDTAKALEYAQETADLATKAKLPEYAVEAHRTTGQAYHLQSQPAEALPYLQKALALAEKINHRHHIFQCHFALSQTYKALGDADAALHHFEEFHATKESVFNDHSNRKLQNLEVLFRTESAKQEAAYYATLYQTEQARRHLAEGLNQIGRALTGTLDLQEILDKILANLEDLVIYDRASLLIQQEEDLLTFVAVRGYDDESSPLNNKIPFRMEDTTDIFVHIYQTKRPLAIPDVDEYPYWRGHRGINPPRAWLGVPLIHRDEVVGMLSLARITPNPFTEDDITISTTLALQSAIAIANAQLYEQAQRRADEMTTLIQIGQDVSASLDLDTVLERIARHAHLLFNASNTIVWLRDEDTPTLHAQVAIGTYANEFKEDIVPIGDGITGTVAETGKAEIVYDIDDDPRSQHIPGTPRVEEDNHTLICAPIVAKRSTIGVMSLYRQTLVGNFTSADLNFLIGLTRQAAIALENARLYEQIKGFNTQLEATVAQRTADLQTAYEQLERLDKTKSDFIDVTAHELRTPLTLIKGYGQLIEEEPDMAAQLIRPMLDGAERMHDIVDTMLMMIKIDSRTLDLLPEPLHVHTLITDIASTLSKPLKDRQLTLTVEGNVAKLPPITGDEEALHNVFVNVIQNAIKYTPDGGRITIRGRAWQETPPHPDWPPHAIEVQIKDTGIGIATDALDLIFTKFYQTGQVANHSTSKYQFKGGGPGLGLAIARGIIEAHFGKLWATSPGHETNNFLGSTFHILLPCSPPIPYPDLALPSSD
ncbi:MAG TPA: GAF domain-containing protein [Anaerolineae bacterium]|nr:GAF domain-containing protein [Anaerolineae bacterium]